MEENITATEYVSLFTVAITPVQIKNYFKKLGYFTCHCTPILNTMNWVAFIIKDGEYYIATVQTDGVSAITGHSYYSCYTMKGKN